MAETVYILGALSSLLCAVLLFRQFFSSRTKLLFWSALCFSGLTIANILVFIDLVTMLGIDLHLLRWSVTAVSLSFLVFGLVWESK